MGLEAVSLAPFPQAYLHATFLYLTLFGATHSACRPRMPSYPVVCMRVVIMLCTSYCSSVSGRGRNHQYHAHTARMQSVLAGGGAQVRQAGRQAPAAAAHNVDAIGRSAYAALRVPVLCMPWYGALAMRFVAMAMHACMYMHICMVIRCARTDTHTCRVSAHTCMRAPIESRHVLIHTMHTMPASTH